MSTTPVKITNAELVAPPAPKKVRTINVYGTLDGVRQLLVLPSDDELIPPPAPKRATIIPVYDGLDGIRKLVFPPHEEETASNADTVLLSDEEETVSDAETEPMEEEEEEEEKSEDWPIHRGYLRITLEDVAVETDVSLLTQWEDMFLPSTQPQSDAEHFYVCHMAACIRERLNELL